MASVLIGEIMKKTIIAFPILVLSLLVTGCSTIMPPNIYQSTTLSKAKTAYVVKNDESTRNLELYIQKAIAKHGIGTSYGPLSRKPDTVDIYVTYVDRWEWDFGFFLKSLDVSFYHNKTNELLATGEFRNSWFHSFPDPDEKAQQVVDSIFEEF